MERPQQASNVYLEYISQHARAYVALMRGGIGSDPASLPVIEGVRRRLSDRFLDGSPFKPMLAGNAKFESTLAVMIANRICDEQIAKLARA